MLGFILLAMYISAVLAAAASGGSAAAGSAVMEGAQAAVQFCIGIGGSLCLWSAVMELMAESGLSGALSRLLRPLLGRLFPRSARHGEIMSALSENVSANLLGLGNAATPAGIRAAKAMAVRPEKSSFSDELCMLLVLNSASIQLLPTTIAAVRAAAGASSAFDITPAVLISSAIALITGLSAGRILRKLWPRA